MSQRTRILTQIVGFRGWKVTEHRWETKDGRKVEPVGGYDVPPVIDDNYFCRSATTRFAGSSHT
jgi:hypothetical protein